MLKKIKAIWELTRLEHGLMYGLGVIIGIIIAGGSPYKVAIFGFLTALFLEAGTFSLNDYCDMESDIANDRRDRPLVRGDIREREVLVCTIVAIATGIIFASFLNRICFLLALILAALGILYDIKIKEFFTVSNFYIAFTMAIPFIFGGLIAKPRIDTVLLVLSSIAFLAGFGREVMKDIMDVKGDEIRNVKSIARIYGGEKARSFAVFSYLLAVILSLIPFFLANTSYFFNYAYLLPVLAADALFVHVCFRLQKGEGRDMGFMRKETLAAIAIGLLAFICGALFRF